VDWTRTARERLVIRWSESGVRRVVKPARSGFGSQLIRRGLESELQGRAMFTYRRHGLWCTLELPLRLHASPSRAPQRRR
jgi:two-component sensor histidine kinase